MQTVVETLTYLAIANKTSDLQPFFGHAVKISADHRHIGFWASEQEAKLLLRQR